MLVNDSSALASVVAKDEFYDESEGYMLRERTTADIAFAEVASVPQKHIKMGRIGADVRSVDVKGCPGMKALPHVDHEKVFRNARTLLDAGAHVEKAYLVVTGANDSEELRVGDWQAPRPAGRGSSSPREQVRARRIGERVAEMTHDLRASISWM